MSNSESRNAKFELNISNKKYFDVDGYDSIEYFLNGGNRIRIPG